MSRLSAKTDLKVIRIIKRALKILKMMPAHMEMTKDDDFELSLAMNMLKSIIENNQTVIEISNGENNNNKM